MKQCCSYHQSNIVSEYCVSFQQVNNNFSVAEKYAVSFSLGNLAHALKVCTRLFPPPHKSLGTRLAKSISSHFEGERA